MAKSPKHTNERPGKKEKRAQQRLPAQADEIKQALPGSDIEASRADVAEAARLTEDYALLNEVGPNWLQDNIRHTFGRDAARYAKEQAA